MGDSYDSFEQNYAEYLAKTYYGTILVHVQWKVAGQDAEDITQEVFARVSETILNKGQIIRNELPYLKAIANNCIADFYKRQKKTISLEDEDSALSSTLVDPENMETGIEGRDQLARVQREMNLMPRYMQRVMDLNAASYTTKEIATELNLAESTVRAYLSEARVKIRHLRE